MAKENIPSTGEKNYNQSLLQINVFWILRCVTHKWMK